MRKQILLILFTLVCVGVSAQYNQDIVIEKLLQTDTTSLGQKIIYPNFADDEVTMCKVTIPPGRSTGWHKHEIPVFAYVIEGTLTVEDEKGNARMYAKDSVISEMHDVYHNGLNKGEDNVVLVAIYLGGKGVRLSVKMPDKQ